MRIRFIPLIFIYYSRARSHVYTYIFFAFFFFLLFLQVVFSFSYIIIISVFIYPLTGVGGKEWREREGHWMRKTFSLAFAKRRAELRFVIYDLMCCLQKTHSLNSISPVPRYLLFIFPIQLPKNLDYALQLLSRCSARAYIYLDSWNVIKNKSFKLRVSRKNLLSSPNTMHYYYCTLSPLSAAVAEAAAAETARNRNNFLDYEISKLTFF